MFVVVIAFTNGTLPCNGVEYGVGEQIISFPTNVCYGQYINGAYTLTKYECNNGQIYWNLYTTEDCNSYPSSSTLFSTIYPTADYINEYCNLSECEYIKLRSYTKQFTSKYQCNSFDLSDSTYTESIHIKDYCNQISPTQSFMYSCDDTICTKNVYESNGCNGTTSTTTTYSIGRDCISGSSIIAYQLISDTAITTPQTKQKKQIQNVCNIWP